MVFDVRSRSFCPKKTSIPSTITNFRAFFANGFATKSSLWGPPPSTHGCRQILQKNLPCWARRGLRSARNRILRCALKCHIWAGPEPPRQQDNKTTRTTKDASLQPFPSLDRGLASRRAPSRRVATSPSQRQTKQKRRARYQCRLAQSRRRPGTASEGEESSPG